MSALPASIEASLTEAGFTATEILIIRRLMEEDGLSVRSLASRTGKGLGVVDLATKKLLKKGIIGKEWINDSYKYVFRSLDAVSKWVMDDLKKKRDALHRKHQDFETFLSTIKLDKKRPEIEYYSGDDGMKKVYACILEASKNKEVMQFLPLHERTDCDVHDDARAEFSRMRRAKEVTARVISQDTPLGRRFQTRDPFEFRKTLLLPQDQFNFEYAKIISGDTITCINQTEKLACHIHYPELAANEHAIFEGIWKSSGIRQASEIIVDTGATAKQPIVPPAPESPVRTQVASRLRQFFCSKESLVSFAIFSVIAAIVAVGVYKHDQYVNLQRLREKVMSIAATGALQFEPKDLDQLHTLQDIGKPEYAKVIKQLNDIRFQNQWVKYTYLLRPLDGHSVFEFIADGDALDPTEKRDVNEDGTIDERDHLSPPGEKYIAGNDSSPKNEEALLHPVGFNPGTDQWGTFISGWAPIKNGSGTTIAVLGVDVYADQLKELTISPAIILGIFVGLFFLFIFIRLVVFNQLLMRQVWQLLKETRWPVYAGFGGLFLASLVFFYFYTSALNLQRMKEQVLSIALTGANQFDANDLNQLQVEEYWKKPEWVKTVRTLQNIKQSNSDIGYAYIFRRDSQDSTKLVFVSDDTALDPYANRDKDSTNDVDANQDGQIGLADDLAWPGSPWPEPPMEAFSGFNKSITTDIYSDQWGAVVSGFVPIKNKSGVTVAVLAIDMWARKLQQLNAGAVGVPLLIVLTAFIMFIVVQLAHMHWKFLTVLWRAFEMRKFVISIALLAELAFFVTLFFYYYTFNTLKNEIGAKLMAIAATAAPEFSAEDLVQLHFARDMKKDAYQRVFDKLNNIRDQNQGIKFVYIYRFAQKPNVYEFIADADSNYNIPFLGEDFNKDGILDKSDENVAPGVRYVPINDSFFKNVLNFPTFSQNFDDSQWGHLMSGTAPIRDRQGRAIAFVGVDMEVDEFYKIIYAKFTFWLWFIAFFTILIFAKYLSIRTY